MWVLYPAITGFLIGLVGGWAYTKVRRWRENREARRIDEAWLNRARPWKDIS